jgi:hypothetical protein
MLNSRCNECRAPVFQKLSQEMERMKYLMVIAGILSLTACEPLTALSPGDAGNPNAQPYLGGAGSIYDQAANPPSNIGGVTYNPDAVAPVPADMSIPDAAPAASANSPATALPNASAH